MASSSHSPKHPTYSSVGKDSEERKALLNTRDEPVWHCWTLYKALLDTEIGHPEEAHDSSRVKEDDDLDAPPPAWSRRKIVVTAAVLIGLLLTGTFARTILWSKPDSRPRPGGSDEVLRSNGTDLFRRTVLIVSIDGLRADYLDRGLTPHLLHLSKKGIRAKSMKPIFPTLTFPNHWALMTGLHAESHGIVANNFWDPATKEEFHYNQISSAWNPTFWLGEPMWETAEKAGVITANLMW